MNLVEALLAIVATGSGVTALAFWIRFAYEARRRAEAEEVNRQKSLVIAKLRPYEHIVNVEAEVRRIKSVAAAELAEAKAAQQAVEAEIASIKEQADAEIKSERKTLNEYVRAKKEQADREYEAAAARSRSVLEEARRKAIDIAGDAFEIKGKSDELKAAARAYRNVIEGYGDRYFVPNASVIDDLADEFDHKQAGRELKAARLHSRRIVEVGNASSCRYSDPTRREYAERFVLDAFNGKVDSILSRVKHDNYGKLLQEIDDAAAAVNHLGRAFRNAAVSEEYVEARRQELRWAVATRELQRIEREEQRAIREQMREEERARREYEKAIREAEKEEKRLEKAMREAAAKLAAASETQRAEYEARLDELRSKLAEAESREERAKSMAQQTRRGHVYVISNIGSFGENVFKIGLTRRLDPMDRVKELGDASVPFGFDVHAMVFSDDAPALEAELHRRFGDSRVNRVNHRKEFFQIALSDVRQVVEDLGLEVHWTMAAEAAEWRESMATMASATPDQRRGNGVVVAAGNSLELDD